MRLTAHTDFALRILMQATIEPGRLLSIAKVAADNAISRNHAMKVVNTLAQAGLLHTIRGRGGGFRLARAAETIRIGEVVRVTEPSLRPADCASCILRPACGLSAVLQDGVTAFLTKLDEHTLADVARETALPAAWSNAED